MFDHSQTLLFIPSGIFLLIPFKCGFPKHLGHPESDNSWPELCPQVIRKKYKTDGSEIVLLTDGEDNTISSCFNEVKQSGAIIHTVALGPSAAAELEELSKMTGEGWSAGSHCIVFSTEL